MFTPGTNSWSSTPFQLPNGDELTPPTASRAAPGPSNTVLQGWTGPGRTRGSRLDDEPDRRVRVGDGGERDVLVEDDDLSLARRLCLARGLALERAEHPLGRDRQLRH